MKKFIYLSAILALAACSQKPKNKAAQLADLKKQQAELNDKIAKLESEVGTKDSLKAIDVSTVTVTKGGFTNYVNLQGHVDAQDNVTAYPQAAGVITAIYVKVGDHVRKGEVLAQLDNSVLKQQIAQAQAQATLSQTVYKRQKNLWDQNIGSEVQFLQAKTNFESAQKQVDALKQQADLYRITSPINGTVDQMDLKLGQAASPGATGIRVVNAEKLKVKADVPESYSDDINQGDRVEVVVPDANDSLMARVTFAAKVIDPSSRSFAIEIKLPSSKELRPNMTAIIRVADYSKKSAIAIPLNAIQHSDSTTYVYVDEDGVAKKKMIKTGDTYGGKTEVLSGLSGGEQLVNEGASDVEDGDKLRVLKGAN